MALHPWPFCLQVVALLRLGSQLLDTLDNIRTALTLTPTLTLGGGAASAGLPATGYSGEPHHSTNPNRNLTLTLTLTLTLAAGGGASTAGFPTVRHA